MVRLLLAKELKEKEEVARIQERMTLAHKNTSKWAKRILKRGKNVDVDTRRALSAQIKRGDDLRRKIMGSEDEDSDENSDDENLIESARKVLQETEFKKRRQINSMTFMVQFYGFVVECITYVGVMFTLKKSSDTNLGRVWNRICR